MLASLSTFSATRSSKGSPVLQVCIQHKSIATGTHTHRWPTCAAIIIGSSQIGKLLGISIPRSPYVGTTLRSVISNIGDAHGLTVLLAVENILLFVVIMVAKKSLLKRYPKSDPTVATKRMLVTSTPTALIVVVVNLVLVAAFNLDDEGIKVVGSIPTGLPSPFEVFDGMGSSWWKDVQQLAMPSLVISLVGFMESISISKSMAMQYPNNVVPLSATQELYAIGLANIGSAMFGGVPVTGGFSRTSVNAGAGARTPLSSLITAVLLLLVVLLATSVFERLPDVTLAATIVVAVAKLFDLSTVRMLWKVSKPDAVVFMVAYISTLALGIEEGIVVACVLSLGVVIKQTTTPHWAIAGRLVRVNTVVVPVTDVDLTGPHARVLQGDSTMWRNLRRFPNATTVPGITVVRYDSQLFFANASNFQTLILDVAADAAKQPAVQPTALPSNTTIGGDALPVDVASKDDDTAVTETKDSPTADNDGAVDLEVAQAATPEPRAAHGDASMQHTDAAPAAAVSCADCGSNPSVGAPCGSHARGRRHVIVDMGVVSHVDYSAMHMLLGLPEDLNRSGLGGVKLWLVNVRGPVRDALRRYVSLHDKHQSASATTTAPASDSNHSPSHFGDGTAEATPSHRGATTDDAPTARDNVRPPQSVGSDAPCVVAVGEATSAPDSSTSPPRQIPHHRLDTALFALDVNDAVEYIVRGSRCQV